MTDTPTPEFDFRTLEAMNEKTIKNQFFVPDKAYIDLGLFKDIPIGVIYADLMEKDVSEETFTTMQKAILNRVKAYQKRLYDTVDPHFALLGYKDTTIEEYLASHLVHDTVFVTAPATRFFDLIIRHTVRNQNNSRPAEKYTKTKIDADQYIMQAIPVTYYINTYPLTLSNALLLDMATQLGESLGVNIVFLNKNPLLFDQKDWDDWMAKIDAFYLDSLGQFTRGEFVLAKQGEMEFTGRFFFARKRFEKCVMTDMQGQDFEQQVQMATAQLDMFCDFAWLQNNDVRLTDQREHVAGDEVKDNKDTAP
jgi:hypothetical protein